MTTSNTSVAKMILESNDSDNEFVQDAQLTVISWFIANDGFRTAELKMPAECKMALLTLKDFIKNPAKYPPDIVDGDDVA